MIFLDTSFLYPLFNVEDDDHARVREVFEARRGQSLTDLLVTTPHVIFETITLIRLGQRQGRPDSQTRHRQAVHAGERLLAGASPWRGPREFWCCANQLMPHQG